MAHPVGWFEVAGPDAGALQRFYADAFGWQIDADNPQNYGMVAAQEGGIGGGVGPSPDGRPYVIFYIAVPDLQAALDQVGKAGGTTVTPPMDVPGGPSLAYFTDPAGNRIGLMTAM
jgi:predicted enzyme related to lactoylglutathione lyase